MGADDSVTVEQGWPEHREADVDRIDGARTLLGDKLSLEEFQRRASSVLEWSKLQEPECRHYVRILDRASTKAYKENRLVVEDYFYKHEARKPSPNR